MKLIPHNEAMVVWPQCAGRIGQALRHTTNPDVEVVRKWIEEGKADLWHGDSASAVTYFLDGPHRVLNIIAVGGEHKEAWLEEAVNAWVDFAREYECSSVIASGRPGWSRDFRKHGFKVTHITGMREV